MTQHFTHTQSDRLNALVSAAMPKLELISTRQWEHKPTPEKWCKKEILGHLIDSAANNHLRFVRAQLAEKEYVSFSYEQNFFVSSQHYIDRDAKELLALWRSYNLHLAHVIRYIKPEKLTTICIIGNYEPASLSFIISDYIDHLNHHLSQILKA